jgi:diguanylate cyclase (GGDEF)-like protein
MLTKQLRVLVAEDGREEIARALRVAYPEPQAQLELTTVGTIPTLLATVELGTPEVMFLDLSLGHPNPLDAVRRVHRAAPGVPLIVCTGVAEKATAARSLSEGAIDYVLKGFLDARTIERVLRAALERNTLEGLADLLRDELTGLYTREGFLALGTRAMDVAVRSGGTLVILCAMIEKFPELQQELGTAAAEETIKETTGVLQSCFRRSDLLARLGKAQFCALALDAAEPSAPILRQRVATRISALNKLGEGWRPLELRMSAGFWDANDGRSFAEFLDSVEADLRHGEAAATEPREHVGIAG